MSDAPWFSVRDSAGVTIVDNSALSSVPECVVGEVPVTSIGTLEGDDAYRLHRVFGATRLSDGRVALVNQGTQELRYYDSSGVFIESVGRAGEGPGEFRRAFYIWSQRGDTVFVGDYRPFQFHVFGPQGEFQRTVRPNPDYINPPDKIGVFADGRSLLGEQTRPYESLDTFQMSHQAIVLLRRDGTVQDTVDVLPNGRWGQVDRSENALLLFPLFESFAHVEAHGSLAVMGNGSTPEVRVYRLGEHLVLDRIVRWLAPGRAVTAENVAAAHNELRRGYSTLDVETMKGLIAPRISDKRPIAKVFPAFGDLKLGRDGRVWVREYSRPDSSGQKWFGFDRDGRAECVVQSKVDQVYEFGSDYVLSLNRDSLGVERVQLHKLGKPVIKTIP